MAVKITKKPKHPINRHLKNKKAYNQYGLSPNLTTSFFVRAKKTCSMLEVDLKDVDQMVQPEYTPWITNMEVNIDTKMLALPKRSSTLRIRAELEGTLNANYSDYSQIYTDGSKMEERVGCAAVTPGENKEIRLPRPFSIFNAKAEAINTAISVTRNTIQSKTIQRFAELQIYNPKVVRMMNQIQREKEHLILMWVPGHVGIQRNEKAAQHDKAALQGEQELQIRCRRLENLDKGETGRNKTS
jgi:hypothetical protein